MPRPKVTFKSTVLDLELENVEITIGSEILKAGKFKASLDVADLLRVQLPELRPSDGDGVMLLHWGQKKIQCIKEVRSMTKWGLKEAKDFVDSAPILLKVEDLVGTVEESHRALTTIGAEVKITRGDAPTPTVLDKLREMLVNALNEHAK